MTGGNPAQATTTPASNPAPSHHGIALREHQQQQHPAVANGIDYAPPRRNSGGGGRRRGNNSRRPPVSAIPSARDLLYVLFKHRVKAAVVAITIFTLAMLAALVLPSKYTSEAQLLVRLGRESLPNSTVAGGPQMMPIVDSAAQINSEAQIFRSREIVEDTVRLLGPEKILGTAQTITDPETLESQKALASRVLAERIEVHTEPLSAIIKVSYEAKQPEQARDIVQAYVDSYLDHRARLYGNGGAGDLFRGLTKDSEAKLKAIEEQIRILKDQTGVSDVTTQKNIVLNRIATLQGTLDAVSSQLVATVSRIKTLEAQLESTPKEVKLSRTTGAPMSVASMAEGELSKLQAELDQKMTTYLPTSPVVQQLEQQVARAQARLDELRKAPEGELIGLNPTWAELDKVLSTERTNQDGLDAQMGSLAKELSKAKAGQAMINDVEFRMAELARQQGMVGDELKKVVEGRNFSEIDAAMSKDKVGSVGTSQAATLPTKASSPNRKLLVVFGLFAALVGGAGTALASEMLDQTVGRPEDLKKLGFTRIVSIPMLRMSGNAAGDAAGEESMVGPLSPETQAIVDLTEHDASPAPAAMDRMRPTRYVRSTSRPGLRIVSTPPRDLDPTLSPREVLQRLRNPSYAAPTPTEQHTGTGTTATISAPATESPLVLNPPASRPTLSPRFMEACHAMLERLVFSPVATGEFSMPRSIAIVGITPGQGVSTIAAHLAAALADHLPNGDSEQTDAGRVLLVDTNLAAPSLHRTFDISNEPGISEWIKQPTDEPALGDLVRHTSVPKLDVLSAGVASVGHTPGRWAEAAAMTLESGYHCVILDMPSMAHAEATARVAGSCDAALLVVEGGNVNREVVRQATQRLAESGVRILGVVLNKRTYPIPEKLYQWI